MLIALITITPGVSALDLADEQESQPASVEATAEKTDLIDSQTVMTISPEPETPIIVTEVEPEPLLEINQVAAIESEPPVRSFGVVISQVITGREGAANQELIELYNNSDNYVDITDWCVYYYSASLSERFVCFNALDEIGYRLVLPARSYVILVSNAWATAHQDFEYDATIASNGLAEEQGKVVLRDKIGQLIDAVGWGKLATPAEGQTVVLTPTRGDVLARRMISGDVYQDTDDNAADFVFELPRTTYIAGSLVDQLDYCTNLDGLQWSVPDGLYRNARTGECNGTPPPPVNECRGMIISEVAANTDNQFIELYNSTGQTIDLEGCRLQTNRSQTIFYELPSYQVAAGDSYEVYIGDTDLKLTKTTSGTVYLLSSDGLVETDSVYYENLAAGTSWAWFGDTGWKQTYALTAGAGNQYQQYVSCEDGYYRSEETGRCRKVETTSGLTPCKEGQYRSEETNRCRSIAAAASTLKPCADDQFRNPATNRCKKIASADDVALADCGEGRERNPATNRCRNIPASSVPEADFAVEPINQSSGELWGWWALAGVGAVALGYAVWEWRPEIASAWRKVATFFSRRK